MYPQNKLKDQGRSRQNKSKYYDVESIMFKQNCNQQIITSDGNRKTAKVKAYNQSKTYMSIANDQ